MKQERKKRSGADQDRRNQSIALLLAGTAAVTAALVRSSYERKSLVLRSYQLQDTRIKEPLRLAFLTDLHANSFGTENHTLTQCILDARPDAVLIGGDMMVVKPGHVMDYTALENLLKGLSGRIPVYYAEGNHEQRMKEKAAKYPGWWESFKKLLDRYQVCYLLDETVELRPDVTLSGLDVERTYYRKLALKKMKASDVHRHLPKLKDRQNGAYHILMAHTPEHMEAYWGSGADLVLCGHYHGGTVVLPGLGALMSPQFRFFPKYARGRYDEKNGGSVGIVSAGLGTHSINIRLLNQPELVMIDLLPKEVD